MPGVAAGRAAGEELKLSRGGVGWQRQEAGESDRGMTLQ